MKISVISIGGKVTDSANTLVPFSTFMMKGSTAIQLEANETKDGPCSFTSSQNPSSDSLEPLRVPELALKALPSGELRLG